MSDGMLSTMYGTMRVDDENTDEYYVVQWRNGPFILHENKFMKGYESPIKAHVVDIVCNLVI